MQGLDVAREPPFRLELQEAGDIGLGELWHFKVRRQRPFQWQTDNAMALPDSDGIEVVPNLPAHQFRVIGKRIERQRDLEGLLNVEGAISAPQRDALETAPVQHEPQYPGEALAFPQIEFGQTNHRVALARTQFWRTSLPSAHPR